MKSGHHRGAFPAGTVLSLLLAGALYGQSTPALAQQPDEASANVSRIHSFSIAPQALAAAIAEFAEQSGLTFAYDAQLTKGMTSAGLKGRMSVAVALDRLLAGSGLQFRFIASSTVTIEKAKDASSARQLAPLRVEGAQASAISGVNGSRDVTATEGTGSFTTGAMTIGSKAPRSIKDTPQSVSVITHEQLEQQNINDFTRALEQAPGVSFQQGGTSLENNFYSRGFQITSIQIDGGSPLTTRFPESAASLSFFPLIDLAQYDHVEVLRGAAGLFTGYGDPSGTINLVRKKPLDHAQVTLDTEWGSWKHRRAVLDASTPLAFDGKLRGRAVVTWQSNEQFYALAEDEKTLLYGVLDYDLTSKTLLTFGASQTNQDSRPWSGGLPRYQTGEDLRLPRETALMFPWNRWDFETTEVFGSIEQQIGEGWKAKLNLTRNEQATTRKIGGVAGSVNPVDNRGPRLTGNYSDTASNQFVADATLSGAFTLFGQRQEVTLGASRSDQDGGGYIQYDTLINSSSSAPYQPYPGGPRFCTTVSVCPTGIATPPVNVFAFDPYDPLYTEPANPLPNQRYTENGQVLTLAYLNMRLTAFDRLHLETGVRWSHYKQKNSTLRYCRSIPTTGTPGPTNCVGRQLLDLYEPISRGYSGDAFSWPPSISLSYDLTPEVIAYLGYADIYQDQSSALDGDLEPLGPVTGENIELGFKWAGRDGRVNATVSVYRIEKQGFSLLEPNIMDRYKRNPDGSFFVGPDNLFVYITNNGTELPGGRLDANHGCCSIQRKDQVQISEGVDTELTGEVMRGWQVSASYTFSQNKREGTGYGVNDGLPFLSIQPKHLYKLWTHFDLGAAGVGGWLSPLNLSLGVNGQSKGWQRGSVCPNDQVGTPDPLTGAAPCRVTLVPYEFAVEPYAVASGRIGYALNDRWSAALNVENLFDKTYYRSLTGSVTNGNWYGEPRSFTLTVRGAF